jgi:hypothetical protein
MKDIEGIERVIAELEPHWHKIEDRFAEENARFKKLMLQDHDVIGRVLKCHLVVEHYMDRFLTDQYGLPGIENLNFFQKASMLPATASTAAFVKPGILRLNAVRNKFGHSIEADLEQLQLHAIIDVLNVARKGVRFTSNIDRIEAFTTISCTFLMVPPPHLKDVFMKAFSQVRVNGV